MRKPLELYDLAAQLLTATREALTATSGGEPKECVVALADHPWDSCCDGLLYVKADTVQGVDIFPAPAENTACSPLQLAATFVVVHARCAPSPRGTARGALEVPTLDAVNQAAMVYYEDVLAVINAVTSVVRVWRNDARDVNVGPWLPIGPEGGCVGGQQTVTVSLALEA